MRFEFIAENMKGQKSSDIWWDVAKSRDEAQPLAHTVFWNKTFSVLHLCVFIAIGFDYIWKCMEKKPHSKYPVISFFRIQIFNCARSLQCSTRWNGSSIIDRSTRQKLWPMFAELCVHHFERLQNVITRNHNCQSDAPSIIHNLDGNGHTVRFQLIKCDWNESWA